MRFFLAVLFLLAAVPSRAEIRDVLKSADIGARLAALGRRGGVQESALYERPNFAIVLESHHGAPASPAENAKADQVFWVRRGSGRFAVGSPPRHHEISAGDFLLVPRSTPYQIVSAAGVDAVVVRVFPATGTSRPGIRPAPRQMSDVLAKSEIDATFAQFDRNQPIHGAPNFTINYVIYPAHAGPWEAHQGCADIYFLQIGTATAQLGGQIQNAKEESPGEPRGTAVTGARSYQIGPGDLVLIPRNTAHHMDPGPGKLGYILMKVWAD
ncbi:MAG TPA: cupin domain-containing protein [Bryobacterales bacterium]|nr:cupin domain-containing protein [Bryobacterales bacterium]